MKKFCQLSCGVYSRMKCLEKEMQLLNDHYKVLDIKKTIEAIFGAIQRVMMEILKVIQQIMKAIFWEKKQK